MSCSTLGVVRSSAGTAKASLPARATIEPIVLRTSCGEWMHELPAQDQVVAAAPALTSRMLQSRARERVSRRWTDGDGHGFEVSRRSLRSGRLEARSQGKRCRNRLLWSDLV